MPSCCNVCGFDPLIHIKGIIQYGCCIETSDKTSQFWLWLDQCFRSGELKIVHVFIPANYELF